MYKLILLLKNNLQLTNLDVKNVKFSDMKIENLKRSPDLDKILRIVTISKVIYFYSALKFTLPATHV